MKTFIIKNRRLTIAAAVIALLVATLAINSQTLGSIMLSTSPAGNTTGLVGHWTMDGNHISGTTVADQSDQGNDGTMTNGPVPALGKVGQAMSFDGTDDHVRISRSTELEPAAVTIAAWIRRDGNQNANTNVLKKTHGNNTGPVWGGYTLALNSSTNPGSDILEFQTGHYLDYDFLETSSGSIPDNQWVHVIATYDPAASAPQKKIYINGVMVASATESRTLVYDATSTGDLYLGQNGGGAEWYKGDLDDVRVYNRALTETEVYDLYSSGTYKIGTSQTSTLQKGLIGHWGMDDGTGSATAADLTPNSNDGTLTNMSTANDWVTGKINGGLDFGAGNDYVDTGTTGLLHGATEASICFWMYYNPASVSADGAVVASYSPGAMVWVDDTAASSGRTNTLSFSIPDTSSAYQVEGSTNLITPQQWGHFCATYKGGAYARIYKNGRMDMEATSGFATAFTDNTNSLLIGSSHDSRNLDAQLDDVRVYNRALTDAEIVKLYNLRATKNSSTEPIVHWTFDGADVSGTTVKDAASGSADGTLTGGATVTNGVFGQALQLDGTDDWMKVPHNTSFKPDNITINLWLKPDPSTAGYSKAISVPYSDAGGMSGPYFAYSLGRDSSNNNTQFIVNTGGSFYSYVNSGGTEWGDGKWFMATITYDGDTAYGYINGTQVATHTGPSGVLDYTGGGGQASLSLGMESEYAPNYFFKGLIDEVSIYNYALSATEVAGLYKGVQNRISSSNTGNSTDLVGHWTMDGNHISGTTLADQSSQGNDATISGAIPTLGKIGQALSFDGTDDAVDAGDANSLEPSAITVSVWLNNDIADVDNWDRIIEKSDTGNFSQPGYRIMEEGGVWRWQWYTGSVMGDALSTSTTSNTQGKWTHIVGTHDGTTGRIYVNGIEEDSETSGFVSGPNTHPLYIGGSSQISRPFDGKIDDVRVYSRDFSATEVMSLYLQGK